MLLVLWVQTDCTGRSLCQIDRDAERRGTSVAPILAQADGKGKGHSALARLIAAQVCAIAYAIEVCARLSLVPSFDHEYDDPSGVRSPH